jgi:hypothetical protein
MNLHSDYIAHNSYVYNSHLVVQVIHNYGHGGSGVTLSWGCAHDAVNILKDILGSQPSTMKLTSKIWSLVFT